MTEDGNATAVRAFERDAVGAPGGIIINMSVAHGPTAHPIRPALSW